MGFQEEVTEDDIQLKFGYLKHSDNFFGDIQTDRQTYRQTQIVVHRKVTLSMKSYSFVLFQQVLGEEVVFTKPVSHISQLVLQATVKYPEKNRFSLCNKSRHCAHIIYIQSKNRVLKKNMLPVMHEVESFLESTSSPL